jgi:hypothetical protein
MNRDKIMAFLHANGWKDARLSMVTNYSSYVSVHFGNNGEVCHFDIPYFELDKIQTQPTGQAPTQ